MSDQREADAYCDGLMRQEVSLLLYIETRCVDYGGELRRDQLNSQDIANLERWEAANLIEWYPGPCTVRLSKLAFSLAHTLRLRRAEAKNALASPDLRINLAQLATVFSTVQAKNEAPPESRSQTEVSLEDNPLRDGDTDGP